MTTNELIKNAEEDFKICLETLNKKSNDYSNNIDALSAFKKCGYLAKIGPVETVLVMIGVKMTRLSELLIDCKEPKNESVDDTILDAINYLVLLHNIIKERQSKI